MSIIDKCKTRYKLDLNAISFLSLFSPVFFFVFIIFGEGLYFAITFFILFLLMLGWHLYLRSVARYRLSVKELDSGLLPYCIYGLSMDEWEIVKAFLNKTYLGRPVNLEIVLSFDYDLLEELIYKGQYEKEKRR